MTNVKTALIIGGGIAGPVAAIALRRAGITVRVCEAYQHTADGAGAMLGIAPNGLAALEVIGAGDAVRDISIPVTSLIMRSWTGKRLAQFGSPANPAFLHVVWRAELYRVLYDHATRAGVRFEHGKRLTGANETAEGVTATFADGSTATADILIGADGIRSTVRELIDPDAPRPRYAGLLGFGGWADGTGVAPTNGAMHMVHGKRAFFSYSVTDDGRAGWFANLPRREPLTTDEANGLGAQRWLEILHEAFAEDRIPAIDILRHTDPADLVITGALEGMPPVPGWSRGRMVLTGDSVHAPSPSSGQGVSLAVESAIELARCLRDLPTHTDAFASYERLRRSRVQRVTAEAVRTNNNKAAGPVARVLRDLTFPVVMKLLAKPEKMAWKNDFRIDWDAKVDPATVQPTAAQATVATTSR